MTIKTVQDLISELEAYPRDMPVLTDGFSVPILEMATIADFNVERSRATGFLKRDPSTERRVLCLIPSEDDREAVDVGGYVNHNPHFITYDSETIQRSG